MEIYTCKENQQLKERRCSYNLIGWVICAANLYPKKVETNCFDSPKNRERIETYFPDFDQHFILTVTNNNYIEITALTAWYSTPSGATFWRDIAHNW